MKIFAYIFALLILSFSLKAQIDTSSVLGVIRANDSIIEATSNPDTMLEYGNESLLLLEGMSDQLTQKQYLTNKAKIIDAIAIAYYHKGDYNNAMEFVTTELRLYHRLNDDINIASCYNTMGLIYAEKGNNSLALDYYFKALVIDKQYDNKDKLATRFNNIGNVYLNISDYDKAIDYFNKCINIYIEIEDSTNIFYSYNNIASAFRRQGKYNEAIQYFNFSLRIIRQNNDYKSMASCLSNIGVVYQDWEMSEKALKYFKEALSNDIISGNKIGAAIRYNNIASAFSDIDMPDSSIYYFSKSKKIFEDYGLLNHAGTVNSNIGRMYLSKKEYSKALKLFFKSLKTAEDYGDYNTVSKTYNKIGSAYSLKGDKNKAIKYYLKSSEIADSLGILLMLSTNYISLASSYKSIGNKDKALSYLYKYIAIKDSVFNNESMKQINEFNVVYETYKKESKINILEKEKAIDKLSIDNKNATLRIQYIIIISAVIGFALVLIFMILLLRQIKAKKRANYLLQIKNEEINQQKEEITAQRDEISHQKETVESHLELIEDQKLELTDSIHYAKHIQNAVLPEESEINEIFPESFIFYKPKDIVSGDFYWFKKYENNGVKYRAVASVDSTGHGVPGAIMSMLGISFLSDVFNQNNNCTNTSNVLSALRERVIKALKQQGKDGEAKDGFDMGLCIIDDNKKQLSFSGANTNLKIVRNNKYTALDASKIIAGDTYSLYEFKGDRMPISITRKDKKEFSNINIDLLPDDSVYLMTDGYVDQFGGEKGGKYKSKKLNKMLIDIQQINKEEQKNRIVSEFNSWRTFDGKEYEQTDDILFIGINYNE